MNSSPGMQMVPEIVRIVITQATRRRAEGGIPDTVFEEQLQRVTREELEPRGLVLLARALPGGRRRFLVKENATGTVCDMLDFAPDGSLETDHSQAAAPASDHQAPAAA